VAGNTGNESRQKGAGLEDFGHVGWLVDLFGGVLFEGVTGD
jgi:hypothetical protein